MSQSKFQVNNENLSYEKKLDLTRDTNTYSSNKSSKSIKYQNIETTPFNLKFDLNQEQKFNKKKVDN